ncbi:MAG: hydantoinase/oxoprolinase family protein [Bryobacterales bacterium]|nr:hydantoinase/oxoprolinase family protein [Bryobacterales bacterium]
MRIGIDAGGTFTDFIVLHDDGRLDSFKIRSNPRAPHEVILAGIARATAGVRKTVDIVHGSTVATNALLERKGVRTAFVTTAGFEDLLLIGRQNRRELYNLTPAPESPIVPRELSFGVPERVLYDGAVESPAEPAAVREALTKAGVESVAICLLHAYRNPVNERAVAEALASLGCYVCASHEISPEFREYERASTTAINAYVGPLMDRYLGALEAGSPRHRLSILQSNGGYLTAREARRNAVRTVLSGPAGGLIAATHMARLSGFTKILAFDMGGTSTDVSLADGAPRETTEAAIDGMPVRVPMLDIHTVGAGGGSIARVDAGGLLRVGPESAGADPGPACYGAGEEATVTDAQVVLGRIAAAQFLGGAMHIDPALAEAAVDRVAAALQLPRLAAAEGIVKVANANMDRAIRAVSVERGYDPRDFALVAFGGGGGLHACELAAQLEIRTVIVPRFAEGLSALGMLLADCVRDYSAAALGETNLEPIFRRLDRDARRDTPGGATFQRSADLRYAGQSYEINVPWDDAVARFHREHARLYGYATPERAVETVTLRVRARRATPQPAFGQPVRSTAPAQTRRIYVDGRWRDVPVTPRHAKTLAKPLAGPLLIPDYGATTLVLSGWYAQVDRTGNLVLTFR